MKRHSAYSCVEESLRTNKLYPKPNLYEYVYVYETRQKKKR